MTFKQNNGGNIALAVTIAILASGATVYQLLGHAQLFGVRDGSIGIGIVCFIALFAACWYAWRQLMCGVTIFADRLVYRGTWATEVYLRSELATYERFVRIGKDEPRAFALKNAEGELLLWLENYDQMRRLDAMFAEILSCSGTRELSVLDLARAEGQSDPLPRSWFAMIMFELLPLGILPFLMIAHPFFARTSIVEFVLIVAFVLFWCLAVAKLFILSLDLSAKENMPLLHAMYVVRRREGMRWNYQTGKHRFFIDSKLGSIACAIALLIYAMEWFSKK